MKSIQNEYGQSIAFYDGEMSRKHIRQRTLEAGFEEALEQREFVIYYQPQYNTQTEHIAGAEALVRWKKPDGTLIRPGEFIPPLEQSGMICEVGMWVLQTAVSQCREWRKKLPDFHISVNISYVQLRQKGIEEAVLALLQQMDLPGEALTLEVTESMQLQDYSYFNKIFL